MKCTKENNHIDFEMENKTSIANATVIMHHPEESIKTVSEPFIGCDLNPVEAKEVLVKPTEFSCKIVFDTRKSLNLPKPSSLKKLIRFFRSMKSKTNDKRTRTVYITIIQVIEFALNNGGKLVEQESSANKLILRIKFTDFNQFISFNNFIKER